MSDKKIKPNQQLALTSLLAGKNVEEASQAAGVDPRTLNRWMKEPAFKTELDEGQAEMTRMALRRLAGLLEKSVTELESLLNNANLKPDERLRVIRTILNGYARIFE